MKKWQIIILVAALVIGGAVIAFKSNYKKMAQIVNEEHAKVTKVDLSSLKDGFYTGSFKQFLVNVTVKAHIENGLMKSLQITEQHAGKGYEAHDTVNRILKAQSPSVDAVTGATGSSKGIMIATYRALTSK